MLVGIDTAREPCTLPVITALAGDENAPYPGWYATYIFDIWFVCKQLSALEP